MPLSIPDDDREIQPFAGAIDISFRVNKGVQAGAIASSASDIEAGCIYFCRVEGKIVEIFRGLGDDHRGAESGQILSGIGDRGNAIGARGRHSQELVIGPIGEDIHAGQRSRVFYGVGEHQYFLVALFGDQADIGKRDEAAVLYPVILGGTYHYMIDTLKLRQFIRDAEIEKPVASVLLQGSGVYFLFVDHVAERSIASIVAAIVPSAAFLLPIPFPVVAIAFIFVGRFIRRVPISSCRQQVILVDLGDDDLYLRYVDDLHLDILRAFTGKIDAFIVCETDRRSQFAECDIRIIFFMQDAAYASAKSFGHRKRIALGLVKIIRCGSKSRRRSVRR